MGSDYNFQAGKNFHVCAHLRMVIYDQITNIARSDYISSYSVIYHYVSLVKSQNFYGNFTLFFSTHFILKLLIKIFQWFAVEIGKTRLLLGCTNNSHVFWSEIKFFKWNFRNIIWKTNVSSSLAIFWNILWKCKIGTFIRNCIQYF